MRTPSATAASTIDGETGSIYLRARYYDSATGRFTSEDPIKDGLNWYVYCGNNPVAFWDYSGLALSGHTEEDAARLLAEVKKATGDSGYYLDGTRILWSDTGEVNGGSQTARDQISWLVALEGNIASVIVTFNEKLEFDKSGTNALNVTIGTAASSDVSSDGYILANEITSTLIHEFSHVEEHIMGIENMSEVTINPGVYSEQDEIIIRDDVNTRFKEALAIQKEQQFRSEMGEGYGRNASFRGFDDGYAAYPVDYVNNITSIRVTKDKIINILPKTISVSSHETPYSRILFGEFPTHRN